MSQHPDGHEITEAEAVMRGQGLQRSSPLPPPRGFGSEEHLRARLEPDLTYLDRNIALASIAVSLKRIADALDRGEAVDERIAVALEAAEAREVPGGLGR
jgi:hypothetical protein